MVAMAGSAAGTAPISAGNAGMIASASGAGAMASAGTPATGGSVATTGSAGAAGSPPAASAGAGGAAAGGATFTEVFNLLAGGCATGGYCHAAGGGTSKLPLVDQAGAYMALVGTPAMGMPAPGSGKTGCGMSMIERVKAGDPDNSLLMQKLEGKQTCGDVMPPGGSLIPSELKLVRDWIAAGAKDD
jgi:hypothetical protein